MGWVGLGWVCWLAGLLAGLCLFVGGSVGGWLVSILSWNDDWEREQLAAGTHYGMLGLMRPARMREPGLW